MCSREFTCFCPDLIDRAQVARHAGREVWDMVELHGGATALAPNLAAVLALFCKLYAHLLLVRPPRRRSFGRRLPAPFGRVVYEDRVAASAPANRGLGPRGLPCLPVGRCDLKAKCTSETSGTDFSTSHG